MGEGDLPPLAQALACGYPNYQTPRVRSLTARRGTATLYPYKGLARLHPGDILFQFCNYLFLLI